MIPKRVTDKIIRVIETDDLDLSSFVGRYEDINIFFEEKMKARPELKELDELLMQDELAEEFLFFDKGIGITSYMTYD